MFFGGGGGGGVQMFLKVCRLSSVGMACLPKCCSVTLLGQFESQNIHFLNPDPLKRFERFQMNL